MSQSRIRFSDLGLFRLADRLITNQQTGWLPLRHSAAVVSIEDSCISGHLEHVYMLPTCHTGHSKARSTIADEATNDRRGGIVREGDERIS